MKKVNIIGVFVFTLTTIAILIFSACQHKPKEIIGPGITKKDTVKIIPSNCSPDTVYFKNTILPLLISNCNGPGCHNASDHAEGVILNNYTNIKKYVIAGNATGSKLYKNMTTSSKIMPPSGKLPQTTLDLIAKWIKQGAKNNYCNDGCDTTHFAYSANIASIISDNCAGCHSTGATQLGTYADLKIQVNNGKLWGAINHASGYLPMPTSTSYLQDCQIKQIQKWIASGAPNN